MTTENAKKLINRVQLFDDSEELAIALRELHDPSRSGYNYYPNECAEHIEALYELAVELAEALKETINEQ